MDGAKRSYLDWNATAPVRAEAAAAVVEALTLPGNPSSVHAEGRAARATVERAREAIGRLVHAPARRVVFTGGGSEANALVLSPSIGIGDGVATTHVFIGATEHACVRDGHRFGGGAVTTLQVGSDGVIALDALEGALAAPRAGRALVSVHLANNETGVIQPIAEIGLICRQANALLHVDAVQAAGKIAIDMSTLGADALTVSAHKLGGPKGIGAVVFGSDRIEITDRLVRGGGQERGFRAGTENVPGIAGFGAAATAVAAEIGPEAARLAALRDWLEAQLAIVAPGTEVFGQGARRLPNTSCFATPQVQAERALIFLDLAGVSVSSGSACSSGKVRRSHVLDAMGVPPDLASGALRVSLGRTTTKAEIDHFLSAYAALPALAGTRGAQAAA
jgi:cysteine desulfurase